MPSGVYKRTPENTKNVGKSMKGKPAWNKGKPKTWVSPGDFKKGQEPWNKSKQHPTMIGNQHAKGKANPNAYKNLATPEVQAKRIANLSRGDKHWKWIEDRTQLKKAKGSEERRSSIYKDWRKNVCNRDNWTCRLLSSECKGRLEVHHILGFTEYPELRYIINNGITLCHFHHPKKREEEKRMIPIFQELLSVSKD